MGGATILCGDFEGADKAGSPVTSVLDEAFLAAFGVPRRGRLHGRFAKFFGKKASQEQEIIELAVLRIMYNEEGKFSSEVARLLLPHLRSYQDRLLKQHNVRNTTDAIAGMHAPSTTAKYGKTFDAGWHPGRRPEFGPGVHKSVCVHSRGKGPAIQGRLRLSELRLRRDVT